MTINKKKYIKISLILISIIALIFLVKENVIAIKEEYDYSNENTSTLALDLNSPLVQNLYNQLNINLINNTCAKNEMCLYNSNYSFLYFQNYKKDKLLSDSEKLYFVFNSLYKNNKFEKSNSSDDQISTLTIDSKIVKDELYNLFGNYSLENFDHNFKISQSCGIMDYVYTGSSYELKYKYCENFMEYGKVRKIKSYKKENYIYLVLENFLVQSKKNKKNVTYYIKNFNSDISILEINENPNNDYLENIFENYNINKYTFRFELIGDNYYLKDIFLGDNI